MKTLRSALLAIALSTTTGCAASTGTGAGDDMNVQTGDVSLDASGFIDDGTRWWTNHSGPLLTGMFDGSPSATIDVAVGDHHVTAQTSGTMWTAQLPDGAITVADTLVTITATEPGVATQTRQQMFAVDSAAPHLTALPSPFRDERTDAIDFASGEPVHDHHLGAVVELASDGCALVYKHAYLLDRAPIYGREVEANPIRWNLDVSDAKVASVDYRLRHRDGEVVRDWAPVEGNGTSYSVDLHRDGANGLGELANHYGLYVIEIRARDWSGLESLGSYCFEYEPLAAPVAFGASSVATGPDSLSSWTLAANSPISRLTNPGVGPIVFEQPFTHYANEPVTIAADPSSASGDADITLRMGWLAARVTRTSSVCVGDCVMPAPDVLQLDPVATGPQPLKAHDLRIEIVDANGVVVAPDAEGKVTIPPRAAGGAPADYRMQLRLSAVANYNSAAQSLAYAERSHLDLGWTGTAPTETATGCAAAKLVNGVMTCVAQGEYVKAIAIGAISLSLNPFIFNVRLGASSDASFMRPTYAADALFRTPGLTWNGGPKNL